MEVEYTLVPDKVWVSGRIRLAIWNSRLLGDIRIIDWPLPRDRVYEIVTLGDITYIFKLASEFASRSREGERSDGG